MAASIPLLHWAPQSCCHRCLAGLCWNPHNKRGIKFLSSFAGRASDATAFYFLHSEPPTSPPTSPPPHTFYNLHSEPRCSITHITAPSNFYKIMSFPCQFRSYRTFSPVKLNYYLQLLWAWQRQFILSLVVTRMQFGLMKAFNRAAIWRFKIHTEAHWLIFNSGAFSSQYM